MFLLGYRVPPIVGSLLLVQRARRPRTGPSRSATTAAYREVRPVRRSSLAPTPSTVEKAASSGVAPPLGTKRRQLATGKSPLPKNGDDTPGAGLTARLVRPPSTRKDAQAHAGDLDGQA